MSGEEFRMVIPLVSVVIPTYNSSDTIGRAIKSVLAQDYSSLEVIVVDDGSVDDTPRVLESIKDTRLRYKRLEQNLGVSAARNRGIILACGAYVGFLDSDDEWVCNKLAHQVAFMESCPAAIGATCTGFFLHRLGSGNTVMRIPQAPQGWTSSLLDVCSVSPGSTLVVRKEIFKDIGPFEIGLRRFEDWDFLLRYVEKRELRVLPEALAIIYVDGVPEPAVIDAAAERLLTLQAARIRRVSGDKGIRRVKASLYIERALARLHSNDLVGAADQIWKAARQSPSRVVALTKRAVIKMVTKDY
jgi:Glycosyltransferases involved in cell wall biogenesis